MKTTLIAFAAIALSSASALAQPPVVAPPYAVSIERVAYADLDLSSRGGDATLVRRIREASDRVCDMGGMQKLEDFATYTRCFSAAMADGKRQMDKVVAANKSGALLTAAALTISGR